MGCHKEKMAKAIYLPKIGKVLANKAHQYTSRSRTLLWRWKKPEHKTMGGQQIPKMVAKLTRAERGKKFIAFAKIHDRRNKDRKTG